MLEILAHIIVVAIIILFAGVFLNLLFVFITKPYCDFKIKRGENKIQWKFDEDDESMVRFKNGEVDYHLGYIRYRTLPSELSKFVRYYGDNYWELSTTAPLKFKTEEEFIVFVKDWKTRDDINRFMRKESGTLWMHP